MQRACGHIGIALRGVRAWLPRLLDNTIGRRGVVATGAGEQGRDHRARRCDRLHEPSVRQPKGCGNRPQTGPARPDPRRRCIVPCIMRNGRPSLGTVGRPRVPDGRSLLGWPHTTGSTDGGLWLLVAVRQRSGSPVSGVPELRCLRGTMWAWGLAAEVPFHFARRAAASDTIVVAPSRSASFGEDHAMPSVSDDPSWARLRFLPQGFGCADRMRFARGRRCGQPSACAWLPPSCDRGGRHALMRAHRIADPLLARAGVR